MALTLILPLAAAAIPVGNFAAYIVLTHGETVEYSLPNDPVAQ